MPTMNYDRYLMTEIEKEEALMEAEDMAQAEFDQRKADYIQYLLTNHVKRMRPYKLGWMQEIEVSRFQWEIWQDWVDSLDNNLIELVRLNLACGDREKAGLAIIESIEAYMDEIAAQAVREDIKRGEYD